MFADFTCFISFFYNLMVNSINVTTKLNCVVIPTWRPYYGESVSQFSLCNSHRQLNRRPHREPNQTNLNCLCHLYGSIHHRMYNLVRFYSFNQKLCVDMDKLLALIFCLCYLITLSKLHIKCSYYIIIAKQIESPDSIQG